MSIFYPIQLLADWLTYTVFAITPETIQADAINFFIYDTIKIFILLSVIIFLVSIIRSYLPPQKVRAILAHKNKYNGNVLASLLGIITPFCSCSAIPLFLGFVQAGVPLGTTFSFLVASPMINEVALILLLGMFGWKIALMYIASGLVISIFSGIVIGKMKIENLVEPFVYQNTINGNVELPAMTNKERVIYARDYTLDILTYDQTGNSKDITQTGNILSDITQEFELNYSAVSAEQTKLQRIVNIDIKPGSDPNSINCKNRKEVISVAIITTNIFDATTVDANTVKFGPTGAKETHRDKKTGKAQSHMEDVDSDGDLDLVLHFRFSDTGIQCGDANATLTGKTNDNFDIAGLDSIRTVQSDNQSIVIRLLAAISGVFSSIVQKIL